MGGGGGLCRWRGGRRGTSGWDSVEADSSPFLTLDKKLKVTAKRLQSWSEKRVGHVRSQLALAKELLHRLKMAQDIRTLASAEVWLKNKLKKDHVACFFQTNYGNIEIKDHMA
jgi:hypothetical protein